MFDATNTKKFHVVQLVSAWPRAAKLTMLNRISVENVSVKQKASARSVLSLADTLIN